MSEPIVNSADENQVKTRKSKDELKRSQELNDLKSILDKDFGRRYIWRLLETCGVYRSSFTGNSTTFFNEGERNIGLKILAEIGEADPDAISKMMKESKGDS
jgi:hypothetical protein